MRLGVLDVGSNTIHLQVVDAHRGGHPTPTTSHKVELRLTEFIKNGSISKDGIDLLFEAIRGAISHAREFNTEEILAFATSALREAKNGESIIAEINKKYEIDLQILSGDEEARLTFLAARRWFGWSAGKLLVLDIGGGSLEVASGIDESPETTFSGPLGAGRLTRDFLIGDPYTTKSIRTLENFVTDYLHKNLPEKVKSGRTDRNVATSKTFRTLARIASDWYSDSPKKLEATSLLGIVPRLSDMTNADRASLPGVSNARAKQILTGAIVARAAMDVMNINELEICPWALREGLILRWLDWMEI